jgi:hypothetical protein
MDEKATPKREITIDGFTYDLCDFCDQIATVGTISLNKDECGSYCNECYQNAHNWRRKK